MLLKNGEKAEVNESYAARLIEQGLAVKATEEAPEKAEAEAEAGKAEAEAEPEEAKPDTPPPRKGGRKHGV